MMQFIKQSDKIWKRTISMLGNTGDTYAIILTERLWSAQKEIEKLEKEIRTLKRQANDIYSRK